MEEWMKELGLVMKISEFGVTCDMLEDIANVTVIMQGGYKKLTKEEIIKIYKECL